MESKIKTTVSSLLSTQLLSEILTELRKHEEWQMTRSRFVGTGRVGTKHKQPNAVNRDQLILFVQAEWARLTEVAVHLQYQFIPKLINPNETIETPFKSSFSSFSVFLNRGLTETELRLDHELQKLNEYLLKRDELQKRFHTFLEKARSKVPVHKQDHEPVRQCPNPKCNRIALFKHTPESLVCVSCGMRQTYLDNNIAYGEEVKWKNRKQTSNNNTQELDPNSERVTVRQLFDNPHLLKQMPKKFELSMWFHYNVESPSSLENCRSSLTPDMIREIQQNEWWTKVRKEWAISPSHTLFSDVMKLWKHHLKEINFTHTPSFLLTSMFVIFEWIPPAISHDLHVEVSETIYLFEVALLEWTTEEAKLRPAIFRKFVLLKLMDKKAALKHFSYFLAPFRQDRQRRMYEKGFESICHYVDSQKTKDSF